MPGDFATIERRDAVAREGVQTITRWVLGRYYMKVNNSLNRCDSGSIPQDDLASNGESMVSCENFYLMISSRLIVCAQRGKVFRILLALMSRSISEGTWGRTLQEWWDLVSRALVLYQSNPHADLPTSGSLRYSVHEYPIRFNRVSGHHFGPA